nr:diphthine methyltransferase [Quercus suber]
MTAYTIDIVSDTVCPWCYVGKNRLDAAIAQHKASNPADSFITRWHPFYLNAQAPRSVSKQSYYEQKFGAERTKVMQAHLARLGKQAGINFSFGGKIGNTRDSHRLIQLGLLKGEQVQTKVVEQLFNAYFEKEEDITNPEVLIKRGVAAGLDEAEVKDWIRSDKGGAEVDKESALAQRKSIGGVPNFTINGKYEVQGADEPAVFLQIFEEVKDTMEGVMSPKTTGISLHVTTTDTPAHSILDVQWSPHPQLGELLGVATSTGNLNFYHFSPPSSTSAASLALTASHQITDEDTLVLSLTWHPSSADTIGATLSDGTVLLCTSSQSDDPWTPGDDPKYVPLKHHSLEAWCLSFLPEPASNPSLSALSGGDDAILARTSTNPASTVWEDRKTHLAGVTAILPLHSPHAPDLIVTGSYDDHIRLLHAPATGRRRVLAELNLGGGIWRLRFLDQAGVSASSPRFCKVLLLLRSDLPVSQQYDPGELHARRYASCAPGTGRGGRDVVVSRPLPLRGARVDELRKRCAGESRSWRRERGRDDSDEHEFLRSTAVFVEGSFVNREWTGKRNRTGSGGVARALRSASPSRGPGTNSRGAQAVLQRAHTETSIYALFGCCPNMLASDGFVMRLPAAHSKEHHTESLNDADHERITCPSMFWARAWGLQDAGWGCREVYAIGVRRSAFTSRDDLAPED